MLPKTTAYAEETPFCAYKGASFLLRGVGKGDVTRRCQRRLAAKPKKAPGAMGNHSWAVFVTGMMSLEINLFVSQGTLHSQTTLSPHRRGSPVFPTLMYTWDQRW